MRTELWILESNEMLWNFKLKFYRPCIPTVAGPKTWNALPEDVTSSQSEYTFHRQLKTWLFKKSFPDVVI